MHDPGSVDSHNNRERLFAGLNLDDHEQWRNGNGSADRIIRNTYDVCDWNRDSIAGTVRDDQCQRNQLRVHCAGHDDVELLGPTPNASCSFNPSTWSLTSMSPGTNNSLTSTVSITTTAPTSGMRLGGGPRVVLAGAAALLFCCFRRRRAVILGVVTAFVLTLSSCGGAGSGGGTGSGGGSPDGGTTKGTYTVTITAKGSEGTVSTTQTLTVQ